MSRWKWKVASIRRDHAGPWCLIGGLVWLRSRTDGSLHVGPVLDDSLRLSDVEQLLDAA